MCRVLCEDNDGPRAKEEERRRTSSALVTSRLALLPTVGRYHHKPVLLAPDTLAVAVGRIHAGLSAALVDRYIGVASPRGFVAKVNSVRVPWEVAVLA